MDSLTRFVILGRRQSKCPLASTLELDQENTTLNDTYTATSIFNSLDSCSSELIRTTSRFAWLIIRYLWG